MKSCEDCKYFDGYDYLDGTPYCNYEDCFHAYDK